MTEAAYEVIGDSRDREAWLEMRRTGVGASDVASILKVPGAWGSPLSVAADKLGVSEDRPMTEPQEAGLRMEQPIAEWAAEEIGGSCRMYGILLRSTEHPWLICTPDAKLNLNPQFTEAGAIFHGSMVPLQVKTSVFASAWAEEPPPHVLVQCLTEQIVTGVPFSYVCTLLMGNRLRWARIERDEHEELVDQIIDETALFWWKVQHGERIEPDASESCRKAIQALWPAKEGKTIALDGIFTEFDANRQASLLVAKEAEAAVDEVSNLIREAMGDAETATLSNGVIFTYKQGKRSRPLLRKEAPENA